jgi:tellurite resistance protein TehA-like permease
MPRIHYTYSSRQSSQANQPALLVRIVAGALSLLALAASAFLGLFIFVAMVGILAFVFVVVAIRMWLFQRKVEAAFKREASQPRQQPDYIDVEYRERE